MDRSGSSTPTGHWNWGIGGRIGLASGKMLDMVSVQTHGYWQAGSQLGLRYPPPMTFQHTFSELQQILKETYHPFL